MNKKIIGILTLTALLLTILPLGVSADTFGDNEFSYTIDFNDTKLKDNISGNAQDYDLRGIKGFVTKGGVNSLDSFRATEVPNAPGELSTSVVKDGDINVLKYVVPKGYSNVKNSYINFNTVLKVPVPKVKFSGRSYTLEIKMKLPPPSATRDLRGFGSLGSDASIYVNGLYRWRGTSGVAINADNRMDGMWIAKTSNGNDAINGEDKMYWNFPELTHTTSGTGPAYFEVSSEDYVIYKWVIDAEAGSFKFYYSTDDGESWIEPYAIYTMLKSSGEGNDNGNTERYSESGVFPTGELPSTFDSVIFRGTSTGITETDDVYNIAYIKVESRDDKAPAEDNKDVEAEEDEEDIGTGITFPTEETPIPEFKDLDGFEWAKDAINALTERRIVSGVDESSFAPARFVTRAEFAKLLVNTMGYEIVSAKNPFADVATDAWYAPYATTLAREGIAKGTGDGYFNPDAMISRQEACTLIYRALGEPKANSDLNFNDADSIADFAKTAVAVMTEMGIIKGDDTGMFRPEDSASRAESAVIFNRLLES